MLRMNDVTALRLLLMLMVSLPPIADACGRNSAPVVRLTCPRDIVKIADTNDTSALVEWNMNDFRVESSRPIQGIYQTTPHYGAGVNMRKTFANGTHTIEYTAIDDSGIFDTCRFTVTIKVIQCKTLSNPADGIVSCDRKNVYGSRCTFSCIPSYKVVGVRSTTCQINARWTDDPPFCRKLPCPDPGTPLHGSRSCTSATHRYGDMCYFDCSRGYKLQGNTVLLCGAMNETTYWTAITPVCKKITPPSVTECPQDTVVTTNTATVELPKPLVQFTSEDGQETPHICTHFGDHRAHNFTLGKHKVRCRAYQDPSGFTDEESVACEFTITIKAKPCPKLPQPLNGFLLCSVAQGGGESVTETTCRLYCNDGFALPRDDGDLTRVFECDHSGIWRPHHRVSNCVHARRPQELKLPSEVFYASSDCRQQQHVIDMRVTFQSAVLATIRMQHECALNPGDCIVEDVVATCMEAGDSRWRRYIVERQQRLLWMADAHLNPEYNQTPLDIDGDFRSPDVKNRTYEEGQMNNRTKRTAPVKHTEFLLPMQFHFGTRVPETGGSWPDEYHRATNRLFGMFDFFERHVQDGSFTIKARITKFSVDEITDSLTYAPIKSICDIGYKFNNDILLCVPCGAGTFYDMSRDRCLPCAPGGYQDKEGQFRCKPCPVGTHSLTFGALSTEQCLDVDDCESAPCQNGGRCVDRRNKYVCICKIGFSGQDCEDRIYDCSQHSCLNGGSCLALDANNYACRCRKQYSGQFCHLHTVDGGWSDWTDWSECSKTCRGGTRMRTRTCNSPTPSHGGNGCSGDSSEVEVCNKKQCPSCRRLRRPYQGSITCEENKAEESIACRIGCPPGFTFSSPVHPVYVCGRNTSFRWPHQSPDNPRCVLPACTRIRSSRSASFQFSTSLPLVCNNNKTQQAIKEQVEETAQEMTRDLACKRAGRCRVQPARIEGCSNRKKKRRRKKEGRRKGRRRTRRYLAYDQEDDVRVNIDVIYEGETVSETGSELPDFHMAAKELKIIGQRILNDTVKGDLIFNIDGRQLMPIPWQSTLVTSVSCPLGLVQTLGMASCVECSPGTYHDIIKATCRKCEAGSYQPESASTSCISCGPAMTTLGRGATLKDECYLIGSTPPIIPLEDTKEEEHMQTMVFSLTDTVAPLVVSTVLVLTIALLGFLMVKRVNTNKGKETRETVL